MRTKVTTGPRSGHRSGYRYTALNVRPVHREDARMTADTHEVAVGRLRAAYTAVPPGTPVRLAKHTSNLFRFRDADPKTPGSPGSAKAPAAPLDVSAFGHVLRVDPARRTAWAGGMTT